MLKKTEKSSYLSKYGAGYIPADKFIAEMMCVRIAFKQKKILSEKFWNQPVWKREFQHQIIAVNALLKVYSPTAILAALKCKPYIYNLRAPWFIPVITEEEIKLQAKNEKLEEAIHIEQTPTTEKPRQNFSPNKTIISKLRNLDG